MISRSYARAVGSGVAVGASDTENAVGSLVMLGTPFSLGYGVYKLFQGQIGPGIGFLMLPTVAFIALGAVFGDSQ